MCSNVSKFNPAGSGSKPSELLQVQLSIPRRLDRQTDTSTYICTAKSTTHLSTGTDPCLSSISTPPLLAEW